MKAKEIEWNQQTSYHWTASVGWLELDIVLCAGAIYGLLANGKCIYSSKSSYQEVQSKAQDLINELGEAIYQ